MAETTIEGVPVPPEAHLMSDAVLVTGVDTDDPNDDEKQQEEKDGRSSSKKTKKKKKRSATTTSPFIIPVSTETSAQNEQNSHDAPQGNARQNAAVPRYLIVGRQASKVDICIQHKSVSRQHALLYYVKPSSDLVIRDLGGKHGTFVNEEMMQPGCIRSLKTGDTIVFGNAKANIFKVIYSRENEKNESVAPTGKSSANNADNIDRERIEGSNATHPAVTDDSSQPDDWKQKIPMSRIFEIPFDSVQTGSSSSRHPSTLAALAVDLSGSRFVTAAGNHLRFYDFASLNQQRKRPFKIIEVEEGHKVKSVSFSGTGDRMLVATGSVQPKILGREGEQLMQFVRGDMYVTDMARTSGHTAAVTGVSWCILMKNCVLTSSLDGSVRTWELEGGKTEFGKLVCDKVYRAKNRKGQRIGVTAVTFHPGGREFALGTACGSIQIWNTQKVDVRPVCDVYDSHGSGNAIHSLTFDMSGSRLASRAGSSDDMVHLWSYKIQKEMSQPQASCADLPSEYEHANVSFSPNCQMVVAGTSKVSVRSDGTRSETGSVQFYWLHRVQHWGKVKTSKILHPVVKLNMERGIVQVLWHSNLNQVFLGFSDGKISILFDDEQSNNGALVSAGRAGRAADALSDLLVSRKPTGSAGLVRGKIITPNALPLFGGMTRRKREQEKEEAETKRHKPAPPSSAKIMTGGASSATSTFQQFVANSSLNNSKVIAGKDPREELFKYQEGKSFMKGTNDGVVLADKTIEEEEEELRKEK